MAREGQVGRVGQVGTVIKVCRGQINKFDRWVESDR